MEDTIQGRTLFINHQEVLTAETIQRRKLFKGGNYMRIYGICLYALVAQATAALRPFLL